MYSARYLIKLWVYKLGLIFNHVSWVIVGGSYYSDWQIIPNPISISYYVATNIVVVLGFYM